MTATPMSSTMIGSVPLSARVPLLSPSSLSLCSRRTHLVVCHSEAGGSGGSCCGGSGASSGGSCSSHGKNSLANVGKEFEQLVAHNTLLEFEKNYDSAPMESRITRDIIDSVMNTHPEGHPPQEVTEKLLNIDEILEEANRMSQHGDLVFSDNPDFVLV